MNCARCGRPVKGPSRYGRRCRAGVYRAADILATSGNSICEHAAAILLEGNIEVVKPGKVWRMLSSDGTKTYLVSANTCNCKGAQFRPTANTCKHSVAGAVLAA
jgi:hypothetical protein